MKYKILITGSNGFIGQSLCPFLENHHYSIETVSLRTSFDIENINLENFTTIIHLGALAHQMDGASDNSYKESNFLLTKRLAEKAKVSGVKKFIFISTVKVYGEHFSKVLDELSPCLAADAYSKSKLQAEEFLQSFADNQFKIAILRLPLVYGPYVKGNFLSLLEWHAHKKIIPFKNISTKRGMIYVGNVCAMIERLIQYEGEQRIFVASDTLESLQLNDLSRLMIQGLKRENKVIYCRFPLLCKWGIKYLKPSTYYRLFEDFKFQASMTFKELNYEPPFSTEQGIVETCNWYLSQYKKLIL